jgi:hypothetical protein
MSVDRLTQLATVIVEGKVTQTWSDWDAAHTRIYSYTRLTVTKSFKGQQSSSIVVKQPGGLKDGIREVVYGVRHFRPGEDAFLFLESGPGNDGTLRVVGLMQGNFQIYKSASGETKVTNGVPRVTVLNAQGQVTPYAGSHLKLLELESRVTKAVGR